VSVLVGVGRAGAALQRWRGQTGASGQLDLGRGLSFGSPSLRRWLLDPEAGGHHGGGFGGCRIPLFLGVGTLSVV
jgi:hypothetical protein